MISEKIVKCIICGNAAELHSLTCNNTTCRETLHKKISQNMNTAMSNRDFTKLMQHKKTSDFKSNYTYDDIIAFTNIANSFKGKANDDSDAFNIANGIHLKKRDIKNVLIDKFDFIDMHLSTDIEDVSLLSTMPLLLHERKKIIVDIFSDLIDFNTNIFDKYRIITRNYFEIMRRRNVYENKGYTYYVIYETDYDDFMKNPPKHINDLQKYSTYKYDVYAAGGWFSEPQEKSLYYLYDSLDKYGYKCYKPKYDGINITAEKEKREFTLYDYFLVFMENIKSICASKCVIASTTENDSGTVFEIALAYEAGMPVYLYDSQLGPNGKINLMLSLAADGVFTTEKELKQLLKHGKINRASHDIE